MLVNILTMHRTVPTTKNYPAPNVDSAEVEKPLDSGYIWRGERESV